MRYDYVTEAGKTISQDTTDGFVLRACPFCGMPPITEKSGEGGRGLMIECITDGCVNPHVSYYDHQIAVRKWNGRTST